MELVEPNEPPRHTEFWDELALENKRDFRKQVARWALGFAGVFFFIWFALHWSGLVVRFSAARMVGDPAPSYDVAGHVIDARTGQPVRWAEVADDPAGPPPFFRAETDVNGSFRLMTMSLAHRIRVTANGYQAATRRIGVEWYHWWPKGSEKVELRLIPE